MGLDDPLRELEALHEAAERISANLVELEIDSSRQLLEASRLAGKSADVWSAASAALTQLWRQQALLENLLERADKLRGVRRAAELRSLLASPSIQLSSTSVPLAQRDLLGRSEVAERCTAQELLASMSVAFDEVKGAIAEIGGAWESLVPKLEAARRLLAESRRLGEELGESSGYELDLASKTLNRLSASVTADPLSVTAEEVAEVQRQLRVIRNDLEDSAALKRRLEARILEARGLLDRLGTVVRDAEAAHRELLLKISTPSPPPVPELGPGLERQLVGITELAERGAWAEAGRTLKDWTARTEAQLDQARNAFDANRAPIEARNQFRALLDAYQVKAKRLGMLEAPELQEIFTQAHEALYTAPSDLALAAQLVRSYQMALSSSKPDREVTP